MRTDSHPPDAPTRPRTLGLVLARGGSEGLPGKNLRSLHGVPLVGRAIETLRSAAVIDRVVLSTDDPEIARVGEAHGAEVIARPAELARADSPSIDALEHAVRTLRVAGERADWVVLVQATCPATQPEDLEHAVELFGRTHASHLVSVTEVEEHPHWMLTIDRDLARFLVGPEQRATRRQDLPTVYRLNGAIYIYRVDLLLSGRATEGDTAAYVMPRERSFDIDTEEDWREAEAALGPTR
ncbi:MAG: acylneuraminate cytidylyltransferase family protein [Planctomycetes bacterium]|nr:acylneuraminate cytidylyltransferase family protein [Planctomycetota bacterium]